MEEEWATSGANSALKIQFENLFSDYNKACQMYSRERDLWEEEHVKISNQLSNKQNEVEQLQSRLDEFSTGDLPDEWNTKDLRIGGLEKENEELKRENIFMKSIVESYYEAVEELQNSKLNLYKLFLRQNGDQNPEVRKISINESPEYCEYVTPPFEKELHEDYLQATPGEEEREAAAVDGEEAQVGNEEGYLKKIKELTAHNAGLSHENDLLRRKTAETPQNEFTSCELRRLRAIVDGKQIVNVALKTQVEILKKKIVKSDLTEREIYELNEKIFRLKCKKGKLKGQVVSLRELVDQKNKEMEQLRSNSADRKQFECLSAENSEKLRYIRYLEGEVNAANEVIEENQKIRGELYLKAEEHLVLKNEYANVVHQLDQLNSEGNDVAHLRETVELQEQSINTLKDELTGKNEEIEAALERRSTLVKDHDIAMNNLWAKVRQLAEENENLALELNRKNEEGLSILNSYSTAEREKATLREEYDVHLGSLNTNIVDMSENMSKMREDWAKYAQEREREIAGLEQRLREEADNNKKLGDDFNELVTELGGLKKTQAYLELTLRENEMEIKMKNEEIQKLWEYRADMADAEKIVEAKEEQLKALRGNFEKLNENFEYLMKYKSLLEKELEEKNKQIEILHFDSKEFNEQLDGLIKSHKLMQAELNAAKSELMKNSQIMEIYRKSGLFDLENEKLKHSKEVLKDELDRVLQEIEMKKAGQKNECSFVQEQEVHAGNLGTNWVTPAYEASWMNDESSRLVKYLERISRLEEENRKLTSQLGEAERGSPRDELAIREKEVSDLKVDLGALREEISQHNARRKDYDNHIKMNNLKMRNYEAEISQYAQKCSALEEQIRLLQPRKEEFTIKDKIIQQSTEFLKDKRIVAGNTQVLSFIHRSSRAIPPDPPRTTVQPICEGIFVI